MIKNMKHTFYTLTLIFSAFLYAPLSYAQTNETEEKAETKQALAPYSIKANYAVFASGFRTLAATANISEEKDKYTTYITIETDGLLGKLAPWRGILTSKGHFEEETQNRIPKMHAFDNIWRGTNKRVEQHYNDQGLLQEIKIKEDRRPEEIKKPDNNLVNGTTDILSAALQTAKIIHETGSCNSGQAVFDGKRRFDLKFKEKSRQFIKASRYTSFNGEAIKCIVEITPDGGKWRDKPRGWMSIQEQSKKKGHPPYIWFGRVTPESDVYIPVKLQVKTSYGTLMLHLKDASYKILE
jgi:hypothetical protein